jgi:hypothetical protein
MTEAIQMTVSSDIANRMDDSNSTASLTQRRWLGTFKPSVVTVMREFRSKKTETGNKKGRVCWLTRPL